MVVVGDGGDCYDSGVLLSVIVVMVEVGDGGVGCDFGCG